MLQNILIVEDNPIIAFDTEEMLRELGACTIRIANGLEEALEAIKECPPQLALLDINLGSNTSYEIARRLMDLAIPFVFSTGYREEDAFPAPFQAVPSLRKPYTAEDLRSVMAGLQDRPAS
jgi:CheY-like chemotaxis protein